MAGMIRLAAYSIVCVCGTWRVLHATLDSLSQTFANVKGVFTIFADFLYKKSPKNVENNN